MFDLFGSIFSKFGDTWFGSQIDTLVDRLNRNVTVAILIGMTLMVSAKQYVGDPIHCRPLNVQDGNFEKYADHICWITNNYYVRNDQDITAEGLEPETHRRINYYQWVPLILCAMAAFFYLPHVIWQAMLMRSGLDLKSVMSTGSDVVTSENREEREKKLTYMAGHLDNYLRHYGDMGDDTFSNFRKKCSKFCSCLSGKKGGSFITLLFLSHKVFYMINIILQILFLQKLLSADIHQSAWESLKSFFLVNEWPESEIFPRQTVCQFDLRAVGNQIHTHVVFCVLSINFFHEKVFVFIWFWILFMAVATGISIFIWILKFIMSVDRVRFVKRFLRIMNRIENEKDRTKTYEFVEKYLRQDGVLALRLIHLNVSGLVTAQLVEKLWDDFRANGCGKASKRPYMEQLDDVDSIPLKGMGNGQGHMV